MYTITTYVTVTNIVLLCTECDVQCNHASYCIAADPALPPKIVELGRIAGTIGGIWKRVGVELGLDPYKLDTIESDNPKDNENAALTMLRHWRQLDKNVSRKVLQKAIKHCRNKKGMYVTTYYCICIKTHGIESCSQIRQVGHVTITVSYLHK